MSTCSRTTSTLKVCLVSHVANMLQIPEDASLQQLLDTFGNPNFVPHSAIDAAVETYTHKSNLDQIYSDSVHLMALLDSYSQRIAEELKSSLEYLNKSEKRVKYQYDLLASDMVNLVAKERAVGQELALGLKKQADCPALFTLVELNEQKVRIEKVQGLLQQAQDFDEAAVTEKFSKLSQEETLSEYEALEKLINAWSGTAEEEQKKQFLQSIKRIVNAKN